MKLRWPHGLAAVVLLIGAAAAIVFCIFEFGIAQRWVRNSLVHSWRSEPARAWNWVDFICMRGACTRNSIT